MFPPQGPSSLHFSSHRPPASTMVRIKETSSSGLSVQSTAEDNPIHDMSGRLQRQQQRHPPEDPQTERQPEEQPYRRLSVSNNIDVLRERLYGRLNGKEKITKLRRVRQIVGRGSRYFWRQLLR